MADPTRELDAADITGSQLRHAYLHARSVHASHGRSYFTATRMLPRARRPSVYALYAFARCADEIVDGREDLRSPARKAVALDQLNMALTKAVAQQSDPGPDQDPVLTAVAHTVHRYSMDRALFDAFLASMRMDTEVTEYATREALDEYMYGSASVIGLQLLPILGTTGPLDEAEPAAASLGVAFQLTNFLRDVGEDLDRGRVYLPADQLASFGVDRALLTWCRLNGKADPHVRKALADMVDQTRTIYREARPGIELLLPESRHCARTAYSLYSAILDEIEAVDYDVLDRRVVVSRRRRMAVAAPALIRAYSVRRARPDPLTAPEVD